MSLCLVAAAAFGAAGCGAASPAGNAAATTSPPQRTVPSGPAATAPLSAPKVSVAQDTRYLTEVTEADPALTAYEEREGKVALRALLTDGSAFCAFLRRGGGIDNAMVSVAVGARSAEPRTHLPLSVTTFNTVESVALLTLCPSDESLVPASVRSKVEKLGEALATRPG